MNRHERLAQTAMSHDEVIAMLHETVRRLRDTKPQPIDYPPITFDEYIRVIRKLEAAFGEAPTEPK